uniref:Ribonuclease H-like domain-containing protein n=1 Tax=Tanacetum cinerariifolium TaxID=118510 RepID=A0A6L2K8J8_TANCI|nr:ribonuclease H-like domain-containing protein [Tanacetum cinerariifolium]
MPALEDISTFNFSSDHEDDNEEADRQYGYNNPSQSCSYHKNHKDHLLDQVIRDLHLTTQTTIISKNLEEHGFVITIHQRTNHKDLQNYLFACFLSQEEPKKVIHALKDPSWIEAMQLFFAYASFKDIVVYQMDVKSAFLYGKIKEEVYVCQPPGFEDPDFLDKVYNVEKALYRLHQAHRACQDKYVTKILKKYGFTKVKNASTTMETQKPLLKDEHGEEVDVYMYRSMIGSLMYLTSLRPDIMFAFWTTTKARTINKEAQIHAKVDGKKVIIHEVSIKRDLQFGDEEGVDYLPTATIFEQLSLIGNLDNESGKILMYPSLVRAATTASSLEADQDIGNINKTQSKVTPNESSSQGIDLGGGPRCQEAMKDTVTQTRVLYLEKTETTQALDIDSLKRKVKKLEKKQRSRTHKLKSLYKVGQTARVESSDDNEDLGEDASKQEKINDIDADEGITLVSTHDDANKDLYGEEVFVAKTR